MPSWTNAAAPGYSTPRCVSALGSAPKTEGNAARISAPANEIFSMKSSETEARMIRGASLSGRTVSIITMSRLYAIADLHLSGSGAKPMDVFGENWKDHARRMAASWDATVAPGDAVLLPGDLSWARSLDEAGVDLDWIGARPGFKVLLRGNHDGWWTSLSKVRQRLPAGCHALQNDAVDLGFAVVVGARGWTHPDDPMASEGDAAIYLREVERLHLSIADADRRLRTDGACVWRCFIFHRGSKVAGRPA